MNPLRYAVHAYAWTTSWSNDTLDLIDHAARMGFDLIEIPLMEIDLIDPRAIRERVRDAGIGVCTSTVCSDDTDPTAEDAEGRAQAVRFLERCVQATADMGGTTCSGVIYSALGRMIDSMPGEVYWDRAADAIRQAARLGQDVGVTVGIEPVNRYETFLVNTAAQALRLREMVDEPNVAVHLDAYHMNIEETDFYAPTREAVPHLCHVHLSESHRGTPGTGTVDWAALYQALADGGYAGTVGLESFIEASDAMRSATCIWRPLAESSDALLSEGLAYLKALEARTTAA